jgi:predicted metal-dependent peptidase
MAVERLLFKHRLYIDKASLNFSINAFTGLLAHELSHIVLDGKKTFFSRIRDRYPNRQNKSELERATDLLVIEKGLGEQLLQFHREHAIEYKHYKSSEGLTKHEIKMVLKKKQ